MNPQEKAKDIYDKMKGFRVKNSHRKSCALKCVDEIIFEANRWKGSYMGNKRCLFLDEVRKEIEKL